MTNLVTLLDNEPRVSHNVIAEHTSNKSKSIQDLIIKNLSDFEEFGTIEVEIVHVKNSVGASNQQKTYYLNEYQTTLLMTYLRNSEIVKQFKMSLVKEFYRLKEEFIKQLQLNSSDQVAKLQETILEQNKLIAQMPASQKSISVDERFETILKRMEKHLDNVEMNGTGWMADYAQYIKDLTALGKKYKTQSQQNTSSFMDDSVLHNNFLDFIYQANKVTHEVNAIRHLSSNIDTIHQSMSNYMRNITKQYEKIKGVNNYNISQNNAKSNCYVIEEWKEAK